MNRWPALVVVGLLAGCGDAVAAQLPTLRDAANAPASVSVVAPTATALPTLPPTAPPAPPRQVVAPAPPAPPRNLLASADGRVRASVGTYTDCSGQTPLPFGRVYLDVCQPGEYFVGHASSVFAQLHAEGVGAVLTWWDDNAVPHVYRVVQRDSFAWTISSTGQPVGNPPPPGPGVVASFQTCTGTQNDPAIVVRAVPG